FWQAEGEAAFRVREGEILRPLLLDATPRVIAFGGGSVTSRSLRHLALDHAFVVILTADPATIVARAGSLASRPNLSVGDPVQRAKDLLEARAAAYAECHLSLSTEGADLDDLVDRIAQALTRDPIAVPLGLRSYIVEVTEHEPSRLTDAIGRTAPSSIFVVTDSNVLRARGKLLDAALQPLAVPQTRIVLPPGESQKTIASVGAVWDACLGAGIDRDALVVAFGGGVIGDLAGFAASTLLRGVRFLQVPTTLLSMVDSSVGGKTGFDHPTGKNLIGTFHQPSAVVVDLEHLTTLPPRERISGLAEIVKIALATDLSLLEALETDADRLSESAALLPIVRRAIEAKARIVRDDEREGGRRAVLNVGHSLGHALEAHGGFSKYLHGEAVALGTLLELQVSQALGMTPPDMVSRARRLFERLGLPISVPPGELASSWGFVASDKKRRAASLLFPAITGPGTSEIRSISLTSFKDAALGGAPVRGH
ncbi:MAG: 3-dehydroquinate synthase, partial [Polyangiaceae bacterium]